MSDNIDIPQTGGPATRDTGASGDGAAENENDLIFASGHTGEIFNYEASLDPETFDELLVWAIERKVADITVQTGLPVYADIGGDLRPITRKPINSAETAELVHELFGSHAMGDLNSGEDLDSSYEPRLRDSPVQLRFRTNATPVRTPTGRGVQITMRALPTAPPEIEKLGIEQDVIDNINPDQGLIMVTGPTGSGKSTLLASMMRSIMENPEANERIVEYSAPIEYVYDGIKTPTAVVAQTDLSGKNLNGDFARAVRNALRRKPTTVLVGESRDAETMEAVLQASLTGHKVMSTVHTIGVPETIQRMLKTFPIEDRHRAAVDLVESLRMVVSQRLYKRVGGGQIGVREYMVFDVKARERLLACDDTTQWANIIREMLRSGEVIGRTMKDSAREAFDAGKITEDQYRQLAARDETHTPGGQT